MKGDSAMLSVKSAITNTIPISNFNRGLAGKIFADVRTSGAKVVIKNNMPECVLLSPEEYVKMVNVIEEAELLKMAISRTEIPPVRCFRNNSSILIKRIKLFLYFSAINTGITSGR